MNAKTKVVIAGAGFAGLYAYQHLKNKINPEKTEIVLIDKNNYFLFTPLLHEAAVGNLDESLLITSLREIIRPDSCRFFQGEISEIDYDEKQVYIDASKNPLKYDYLILATGAKTKTYEIPRAEKAIPLKTIIDARNIKNSILNSFEQNGNLNFAIIGGGPTGTELTAEISEYIFDNLLEFYPQIQRKQINLYLITKSKTLIPGFRKINQKKALNYLKKNNVNVILESGVKSYDGSVLTLENDKTIECANVYWVPGVEANVKIEGNQYGQMKSHSEVFAAGDLIPFTPKDAQAAIYEAKIVSENIIRIISGQVDLKEINYKEKGKLLSLGCKNALGEIGSFNISGRWVWFLWRTVYLFKMISLRKKVLVAANWTLDLFTPRDTSMKE